VPLPIADGFVASARTAAELVTRSEVRDRWDVESSCAGMTNGGLANHLADQTTNTLRLLAADPSDLEPIPVLEHYRRASWVHAGPGDEPNTGIRDGSNVKAQGGYDALAARVAADLDALPAALGAASDRSPDSVLVPWQGWALTTDDFLVTRLMEIAVHSDDLAAGLGVPTPEFPDDVVREVLGLLSAVAVDRHGQAALLRALSRPQRAPSHVSAFGG
jgi:hypothetical protein